MLLVKQLVRVVPCLSSGVAIARGGLQISTGPYTAKLGSTTHRLIRRLSNSYSSNRMDTETYAFGPYKIDPKEVFYSTHLSYAMVNLRPLLPGHILFCMCALSVSTSNVVHLYVLLLQLCFLREVKRFVDLTADEISDLWLTAQKVGSQLESYHKASSLTFAIQDGTQAGQTVPHVHIHIVPRKGGDFEKNDEIYDAIDMKEKELQQKLDLDKERKDRSMEEMAEEAQEYRKLLS
ncbi:unnamed protein product [Coffea canephora]|uniref:Bis(5'-adenosyl)-triphosphatase n=1 Tax=Coffea canephora TaxID=49390 RepID=A0A068U678_COFCA|nr:unnamed protein product [Coffea canephora]